MYKNIYCYDLASNGFVELIASLRRSKKTFILFYSNHT